MNNKNNSYNDAILDCVSVVQEFLDLYNIRLSKSDSLLTSARIRLIIFLLNCIITRLLFLCK